MVLRASGVSKRVNEPLSAGRRRFLALLTIILSLGFGLCLAERVLVYQRHQIENSDSLDPGMVLFDATTGWRLSPGWSGYHSHHDFHAKYSINETGFRGRELKSFLEIENRYVVLGDSFAFGMGVDDNQVFDRHLDNIDDDHAFLNLGTPGFSTDQSYLLLQQWIERLQPKFVLLVVYLGNDIFDNERSFPLQGEHVKPQFNLQSDGTLLAPSLPLSIGRKPAALKGESLVEVVLGDRSGYGGGFTGWLGRLELFRRLGLLQPDYTVGDAFFSQRFESALQLFQALVVEMGAILKTSGSAFELVLLPGRSYVEEPGSLSYQYQDFLRRSIVSRLESLDGVMTVDLASSLREAYLGGVRELYFPNEGHLTPAGHRLFAELLAEALRLN